MRVSQKKASEILRGGGVVAVPTETVYGLAACLDQPAAIEQIFSLKRRPRINPLIVHLHKAEDVAAYITETPLDFELLAKAFWPGPLTCILPIRRHTIPAMVCAGLATAGFRIPKPAGVRLLIAECGPLVMPSANLSGRPSATRPEHVEEDFGHDFPILEGPPSAEGLESTIIHQEGQHWSILRLGALTPEQFEPVLGYQPCVVHKTDEARPLCPGRQFRHYAPQARLIGGTLEGLAEAPFVLGFKERIYPAGKRIIYIGSLFKPEEVAENLYHALRELDREGAALAWLDMDFPRDGLWLTIAERLARACEGSSR